MFPFAGNATDLLVKVYSGKNVRKASITVVLGKYRVRDGVTDFEEVINKGESVTLVAESTTIKMMKGSRDLGSFPSLLFEGEGLKAIHKITPEQFDAEERIYDDHLQVTVANNFLNFINVVDLENYVAGVIQSEVLGSSDDVDFFKVQAIISRTYAMNNILKHDKEGFNLCDAVHCQVYKSRNNNAKILRAAVETAGKVLIDENHHMISAAFHSNSGGFTINSEDVWNMPVSYLKAITDTFSLKSRNATWQKKYTNDEWLKLLKKYYNYDVSNPQKRDQACSFVQEDGRLTEFCGIPLKNMRKDLGLKSTYFSVKKEGNDIILTGKGYGHGVGLSQEGAAAMIKAGYSVEQVLKFYYTNVEIVDVDSLNSTEE